VKHPPPWLFVLTGMPYGVVGSFAMTVMPYVAAAAHIEIEAIGWYGALLQLPTVLLFLYAPLVDIGPRRKHWLVAVSVLGAACLLASCVMPLPQHVTAFLAFATAAQIISGLVGSCNGGLMAAALPDEQRGKASGWYQTGNLSGGGLAATVALWMVGHQIDLWITGLTLAAMMVVPALAALWIDEPPRPPSNTGVFRQTLGDVRQVLFSRLGITGIALCVSPVGTSALTYYFSGMTQLYGAGPNTAVLVTGLGSTGLTAVGAIVGGYLCDRYNRRVLYLGAGALTAVCGIVMALSPRTAQTYIVGVTVYTLIAGFGYAAFTATALETIGKNARAAATQFSLFVAAGNFAILYVGLIDTRFEAAHGVEGVIWSDATLNLVGIALLTAAFWRLGSFGKWRHPADPADPADPTDPADPARSR